MPLRSVESYETYQASIGEGNLRLLADEHFKLGLMLASRSSFLALEAALFARKAPSESLKRTIYNYYLRSITRATPFGTFAGVGQLDLGESTSVQLAAPGSFRKSRLDGKSIECLAQLASNCPEAFDQQALMVNPLLYLSNNSYVLDSNYWRPVDDERESVVLRPSAIIEKLFSLLNSPKTRSDVVQALTQEFPQVEVEKVLSQLIAIDAIVIARNTVAISTNSSRDTIDRIPSYAPAVRIALEAFRKSIDQADLKGEGDAISAYCDAQRTLATATGVSEESINIQVDSGLTFKKHTISSKIAEEICGATTLLLELSPYHAGPSSLQNYKQAFSAKYNQGEEVPLLELFSKAHGILFHANDSQESAVHLEPLHSRVATQIDMLSRALRNGGREVELSKADIDNMRVGKLDASRIPKSLDIIATVLSESEVEIDKGNYSILIGRTIGSVGAGKTLSRFDHLLSNKACDKLISICDQDDRQSVAELTLEALFTPAEARLLNVTSQRLLRKHALAWGGFIGMQNDRTAYPRELFVGLDSENTFYARWSRTGQKVRIVNWNMLNLDNVPRALRFLLDIAQDGTTQLGPFSWGPLESAPFLPRLKYGRIILRPAEWKIHNRFKSIDELHKYIGEWDLPQNVYLVYGDNRLLIDTTRIDGFNEIVRAQRNSPVCVMHELLPDLKHAWVSGEGGRYFSELVFSLVRNADTDTLRGNDPLRSEQWQSINPQATEPICQNSKAIFSPGSNWLYAKLYLSPFLHNDFITGQLQQFISRCLNSELIDSWFFLRFSDPEPHIRLRVAGDSAKLRNSVAPLLLEWINTLSENKRIEKCTIDTYAPEIDRYGGLEGLALAEEWFRIDSSFVQFLLILHQTQSTPADMTVLAVASSNVLLGAFYPELNKRLEFLNRIVTNGKKYGAEFREKREKIRCLVLDSLGDEGDPLFSLNQLFLESSGDFRDIATQLRSKEVKGRLSRPLAAIVSALIHMHLNRLLPIGHDSDVRILALLTRALKELCIRGPNSL